LACPLRPGKKYKKRLAKQRERLYNNYIIFGKILRLVPLDRDGGFCMLPRKYIALNYIHHKAYALRITIKSLQ
jgi:hypothetical protein